MSLTSILNNTKKFIVRKIFAINNYIDNTYPTEVLADIEFLSQYGEFNQFEKDNDDYWQLLKEKYTEEYCPCTFYKFFSFEQQLNYLNLRVQIDDLIK